MFSLTTFLLGFPGVLAISFGGKAWSASLYPGLLVIFCHIVTTLAGEEKIEGEQGCVMPTLYINHKDFPTELARITPPSEAPCLEEYFGRDSGGTDFHKPPCTQTERRV